MDFGVCGSFFHFWKTKEGKPQRCDTEVHKIHPHKPTKAESIQGNDSVSNGFSSPPRNSSLSNERNSKSITKDSSRRWDVEVQKNSHKQGKTVIIRGNERVVPNDFSSPPRSSNISHEGSLKSVTKGGSRTAEAFLKLRRADEAVKLVNAVRHSEYNRQRKACKGTAYLLIIEAQIHLYFGRFEKGVLTAEKAVDLDSTRKSLKWLRKARGAADARKAGNDLFKEMKYLEACTEYDHGLQYVPTNSVLLCNRAACRSKLEQWEKAIDDCNAALRERHNYHKALLRRAYSYARLGNWEKSLWDYEVLSKQLPGDEYIANSLHQVQMELKAQTGQNS